MNDPVYVWSDHLQCKVLIGVSVWDGRELLPDRAERRDSRLIEQAPGHDRPLRPSMRCACGTAIRGCSQCVSCRRAAQTAARVQGPTCRECGVAIGREAQRCKRCVGYDRAEQLGRANRLRWDRRQAGSAA